MKLPFTLMTGDVLLKKPNSDGWIKMGTDSSFVIGDNIRTKINSRAEIAIGDLRFLRIAPQTVISIDSVVYVDSLHTSLIINVISGDIWGDLKKNGNSGALNIKSGPIETRIGNGIFRMSVGTDGTTEFKLYEGTAAASHLADTVLADTLKGLIPPDTTKSDSTGIEKIGAWKITLGPMEKVIVTARGKIVYNGKFNPDDIDEMNEWVDWNRQRDLH